MVSSTANESCIMLPFPGFDKNQLSVASILVSLFGVRSSVPLGRVVRVDTGTGAAGDRLAEAGWGDSVHNGCDCGGGYGHEDTKDCISLMTS